MENTQVMVIMNRYITATDIRIDRINPTTHITVSRKSFIIVHFFSSDIYEKFEAIFPTPKKFVWSMLTLKTKKCVCVRFGWVEI